MWGLHLGPAGVNVRLARKLGSGILAAAVNLCVGLVFVIGLRAWELGVAGWCSVRYVGVSFLKLCVCACDCSCGFVCSIVVVAVAVVVVPLLDCMLVACARSLVQGCEGGWWCV